MSESSIEILNKDDDPTKDVKLEKKKMVVPKGFGK